jgi:hypothetical protein
MFGGTIEFINDKSCGTSVNYRVENKLRSEFICGFNVSVFEASIIEKSGGKSGNLSWIHSHDSVLNSSECGENG